MGTRPCKGHRRLSAGPPVGSLAGVIILKETVGRSDNIKEHPNSLQAVQILQHLYHDGRGKSNLARVLVIEPEKKPG
jgi:hypothetical protein